MLLPLTQLDHGRALASQTDAQAQAGDLQRTDGHADHLGNLLAVEAAFDEVFVVQTLRGCRGNSMTVNNRCRIAKHFRPK